MNTIIKPYDFYPDIFLIDSITLHIELIINQVMKTILVPVDFSSSSNHACHYALRLAKLSNARLILFHAFETPVVFSDVQVLASQVDYTVYKEQAEKNLQEFYISIMKIAGGIMVETDLKQGLASSMITDAVIAHKADLVVMGTTGKGKLERLLIGSNSMHMVKKAPCLVLLVPPDAALNEVQKMVYATDLTEENLTHAQSIIPFAKVLNAELLFLNVHFHTGEHVEDDILEMEKKIKKYVNYPKVSGFFCHDKDIMNGINYFVGQHQASCLVMYTRHRGLMDTLFNPSLTVKMAIHTHIPILITHELNSVEK